MSGATIEIHVQGCKKLNESCILVQRGPLCRVGVNQGHVLNSAFLNRHYFIKGVHESVVRK